MFPVYFLLQQLHSIHVTILHKEEGAGLGFSLAGGADLENKVITVSGRGQLCAGDERAGPVLPKERGQQQLCDPMFNPHHDASLHKGLWTLEAPLVESEWGVERPGARPHSRVTSQSVPSAVSTGRAGGWCSQDSGPGRAAFQTH